MFLSALGFLDPFKGKDTIFQSSVSCENFISPPSGRMTYINTLLIPVWPEQPTSFFPFGSPI